MRSRARRLSAIIIRRLFPTENWMHEETSDKEIQRYLCILTLCDRNQILQMSEDQAPILNFIQSVGLLINISRLRMLSQTIIRSLNLLNC